MAKTIKVALAGAGAFGIKHLDGIKNIPDVEVVSLVGRRLEPTKEVADKYGIKHVQVEIPLADSLQDAQAVVDLQKSSGLVAMCGHTRRFNPSHQFVHKKI